MKSNLITKSLSALLLLCVSCFASTTTLTGNITDSQGTGVNGLLYMTLPVPAQDTTTNSAVAPIPTVFRLVNGAITGGAPLYDVATLQPQNLFYKARAFDNAGNLVFYGNYIVTGGTFNLGAATPTSITTSNVSYVTPATLSGNNTWTGSNIFQGVTQAPTVANNDNSTNVATTAWVNTFVTTNTQVVCRNTTPIFHTGDTTLDTIYTCTLPILGANSIVTMDFDFAVTSQGAGNTNLKIFLGTSQIDQATIWSSTAVPVSATTHVVIMNAGAVNSQVVRQYVLASCNFANSSAACASGNYTPITNITSSASGLANTGGAVALTVKVQNTNNSDQQIFGGLMVAVNP